MNSKILRIFYERYSREIYLYIYSMCHDRFLSEDLTQETFIKALLSLTDDQASARAWLYTVAHNLCMNALRSGSRQTPVGAFTESDDEDRSLQADTTGDLPLDTLLTDERDAMLYRGMNKLPQLKRQILYLQYFSELSQRDISRLLGITPENVRVLAFRAKKELKQYLLEAGYELS